jgi:glycine/sarcosine N-methyltransferase
MTDTRKFYEELAPDYHLLFDDWWSSAKYQAGVISKLLGPPPRRVLDVASRMGTQALGLADLGYEVEGRDLSPALVERAAKEAEARGLPVRFSTSDMRERREEDLGRFGAVIAFDNALPHLLHDEELLAALSACHHALEPGGPTRMSTRSTI